MPDISVKFADAFFVAQILLIIIIYCCLTAFLSQ